MRLSKLFHLNYIAAGYIALGALGGLLLLLLATCTYKEIGKCCRRKTSQRTQREHQQRKSEQGAFTVNSGRMSTRQNYSEDNASRVNGKISLGTQHEHQQRKQQSEQAAFTVKSGGMSARQDHSDQRASCVNGKISQGTQHQHQQREQQSEQGAFTVNSGRVSTRQDHSDQRASRTNGKSEDQYKGGEQPRKGVAMNSAMTSTGQSHSDNNTTRYMNEQISQGTQRKHQQREQQSEQGAFTVNTGRASARQDHSDQRASRKNGNV